MRADLAVHHPARRHDVGAGTGLGERRPWRRSRAWRRCRRRRRSSSTPQWPWSVYSSTHRSAISTTSSPTSPRRSARASCTMPSGSKAPLPTASLCGRHAEQHDGAHAERGQLGDLLAQALAGVLDDAGQRRDRLRLVDALAHEQRGDEVARAHGGLGDEVAQRRRAAQAARPVDGERGTGHRRHGMTRAEQVGHRGRVR